MSQVKIYEQLIKKGNGSNPIPPPSTFLNNAVIVCDGNSLTFGFASTNPTIDSYPAVMQTLSPLSTNGAVISNVGVTGQSTENMEDRAAANVDVLYNPSVNSLVVAWEGGNDIYAHGDVTFAYNNYVDYMLARMNVGFKTIAVTCPPRGQSSSFGDSEVVYNGKLQAFNSLLLANYKVFAIGIVDPATDSRFQGYSPDYYFSDLVHYTDLGYAAIAGLVRDVLVTF